MAIYAQQLCPLVKRLCQRCRSPFIIQVEDTQRDLIDPAVKGTRNVLAAAAKAIASVQRVVLTSSVAGPHFHWLHGRPGALMALREKAVLVHGLCIEHSLNGLLLRHTHLCKCHTGSLRVPTYRVPGTKARLEDTAGYTLI